MQVKLEKHGGAVKINVDGQIIEPLSFKSFRPSAKNISDFYKAGVRVFDILTSGIICKLGVPYSLFGESWIDDNTYDFEPVDRQIELFLENAPEAYFALMIQIDTREWYCKKHNVPYTFTHLSQEVLDRQWREASKEYLRQVVRHTEEKYGDRFYGYFILGGQTTEWFSADDDEESYPTKLEGYKKYVGDENAVIPEKAERDIPKSRVYLDPVKEKNLVNYRKFHSEIIADAIVEYAHTVKEATNYKKLCGVYYGYLFELGGKRLWDAGTMSYEKVFTCPDIDMISSPSSYEHRAYDDVSAIMLTSDTLDIRDKLYFLEFDHITHLAPQVVPDGNGIPIPGYDSKFKSESETVDVMRRDFMLCCARRLALWWFDMFEGWFYSDSMMAEVKRFIEIAKEVTKRNTKPNSEVCVIAEGGESLCYVNKHAMVNKYLFGAQREGLGRMGAPYDVYSVCDLDKIDFSGYKLVIFLDEYKMSDATRSIINEKIKKDGKTVMFYGCADGITDNGIDLAKASEMIGMSVAVDECAENKAVALGEEYGNPLCQTRLHCDDKDATVLGTFTDGKVSLAMKEHNGCKCVFSSISPLSGKMFTEIAKIAGVHIYTDKCPVYVNSEVIGLYMNIGEDVTVALPEDGTYVDAFTGNEYTSKDKQITVPYGSYRSVMLLKK